MLHFRTIKLSVVSAIVLVAAAQCQPLGALRPRFALAGPFGFAQGRLPRAAVPA
jgi:hypothetical protein